MAMIFLEMEKAIPETAREEGEEDVHEIKNDGTRWMEVWWSRLWLWVLDLCW